MKPTQSITGRIVGRPVLQHPLVKGLPVTKDRVIQDVDYSDLEFRTMTQVVAEEAVQFRYRAFLKNRSLRTTEEPETGEYHFWLMDQYAEWAKGLGFPRDEKCHVCAEERNKDWGRMGYLSCGESGFRAALAHGIGDYADFDAWLGAKHA